MNFEKKQTTGRPGLIVAFSLMADVDPRDLEREERERGRTDTDPFDPNREGEHVDPDGIPSEGGKRPRDPDTVPDDLEHTYPEDPDERREDRERGGDSPLDDMTIPKDPNGKNVG